MESVGNQCWAAVFCKPRQEATAELNLVRQGFHVYLPRIRVKQRLRGRWVESLQALFPRYLFIKIIPEETNTSTVRSTLGVVGMVRFGGRPATVQATVIDELARREHADAERSAVASSLFREGEAVKVVDGPLAGLEGVFGQPDGDKRVLVLMDFLGKINRVRLSSDWIASIA